MSNNYNYDNDWLSSSQGNENGYSNGGWNGKTNKWEAHVYPKGQESLHYTSISHRKVSAWLNEQRQKFDLK